MAKARPVSLIIGAIISGPSELLESKESNPLKAEAQATTASCQVERNPFPVKLFPSGVGIPFV